MKKNEILILFVIICVSAIHLALTNQNDFNTIYEVPEKELTIPLKTSNSNDWEVMWGGSSDDRGVAVVNDDEGNVYVAGTSDILAEDVKMIAIVKYNKSGDYQWHKIWHGSYITDLLVQAMVIDSSSNLYIAGYSYRPPRIPLDIKNSVFLVKFNSLGNLIWEKNWDDGPRHEEAYDITLDNQNNIYLTGRTEVQRADSSYHYDFLLQKYSSSGTEQWTRIWGTDNDDGGYGVSLDSLGSIYICGIENQASSSSGDFCIYKRDTSGYAVWDTNWYGPYKDVLHDIDIDSGHFIYVSGLIGTSSSGNSRMFTAKCNSAGIQIWNRTTASNIYYSYGLARDSQNNLFVSGKKSSFLVAIKYNKSGDVLWEKTSPLYSMQACNDIHIDSDDNVYLIGTTSFNGNYDFYLMKFRRPIDIQVNSPTDYQLYSEDSPDYEIIISDPDEKLNTMWYTLNNGMQIIFTELTGKINQSAWDLCENGTVSISFCANDSWGYIYSHIVIVQRDIMGPLINIIAPSPFKFFSNQSPSFELDITDGNLHRVWYSLNGGENFTIEEDLIGDVDQDEWISCPDGEVILQFYANDTLRNKGMEEVTVLKDVLFPEITILSPLNDTVYGVRAPLYNLSIYDIDLNYSWYTINASGYYPFTGFTGSIDQDAWDNFGNGQILIQFYANNSAGSTATSDISVLKNIELIINNPVPGQLFGIYSPDYNITLMDHDLYNLTYTINNVTYDITELSGKINQTTWSSCEDGNVSLKFTANYSPGINLVWEFEVIKQSVLYNKTAYAIIVGISDYPGSDYDLSYCDDDASAVYNMLLNEYNFRSKNIIYLQDSSATRNGINNAFNSIASIIQPDDIFYFYYSGHGGSELVNTGTYTSYIQSPHPYPNYYDYTTWRSSTDAAYIRVHFETLDLEPGYDYLYIGDTSITEGYYYQALTGYGTNFWSDWIPVLNDNRIYLRMVTDGTVTEWGFRTDQMEVIRYSNPHYLCSYDSIPSNPSNYYLDTLLDSKLDSLNCDNKYVILDSCNSGGIITESQDVNRYIMTACKGGQVSMEDHSLGHGVFTHYLLNSLDNTNDQNHDGVISIEECFSYVSSGTRSFSANYGPGYQFHPQQFDGINGQAVLYPSIGSIEITNVDNLVYYSFYLYGHGSLKTLNITACSISPSYSFKVESVKEKAVSPTGFGYYSGFIELEEGYISGGIQIFAQVEGHKLITINLTIGDSDGDGLTDFFEILEGNGLDPYNNDTDADGLNDYDEFYGPTDPLDADTDSDGLLDGEEVNIYNTNPLEEDSDMDGLTDYEEIMTFNTNPLLEDTDMDGLTDYEEIVIYNTDPLEADSDFDGLIDGNEINIYLTDPLNNDTDSDQLTDGEEIITYNTDPLQEDSDSDGLTDGEEIITYNTDPLQEDSDSDGLTDGEEINDYNTDPLNGDTDSDTIPDGWEVDHSLDPTTNDTALDPDMDLLINLMEYQYNTHPFNNDTDSDGLMDGIEVYTYDTNPTIDDTDSDGLLDGEEVNIYGTNPLNEDTDLDGLTDGEEVNNYGTDPLNDDTDFDTMPDYWEVVNSLNPLVNDTTLDPDLDNLVNIEEYSWDTDPQNPDTDGDGWSDGDEVHVYATDPLDPDSYPPPSTPPGIPGYNIFILILIITLIALTMKLKLKEKEI